MVKAKSSLKVKNVLHPAEQYAHDVISGKILANEYVKLAAHRYFDDQKEGKKRGLYFDPEAAQKVIDFFHICRYHKGEVAGQLVELKPWQQFIFWNIYGWKRANGTRRFRNAYIEVARKNEKTTLEAIAALYGILLDGEMGAQVYCGATKEEQATILVNDAGRIAKKTSEYIPSLKDRLKYFEYQGKIKRVVDIKSNSFIAALGRDSDTQDGFDPSMGIMDERHAHRTNDVSNVIESGMGARKQPILVSITTAGFNRAYPCYQIRKTVIELLQGIKEDDSFFGIIFTLDENDDWEDPKVWAKANPNIGYSVKNDFLQDQYTKAKNEGGEAEVNFKTKLLNIWTDSSKVWIQNELWEKCIGIIPENLNWNGGLDLSSTSDFNAYALTANRQGKKYMKFFFWIPEDSVERRKKDGLPIQKWIDDGWVKTTPGNITDYNFIKADILKLHEEHKIGSSAFDRWNSSQLVLDLIEEGIKMTPFGQGFASMSTPTKEFEMLIRSCNLIHDGNPVMSWMMGNIVIKRDPAGNIKIDKEKSSEKVDGPVAGVMSLGEYMTAPPIEEPIIDAW